MLSGKDPLDFATAESLAFGTLLLEGFRVRLSGQDSGRGTFSQRHAIFFDYATGKGYVPLNALSKDHNPISSVVWGVVQVENALGAQTMPPPSERTAVNFSVYDSLLSEYGVMGFEYGYSVSDPGALVLWEAQFGDFVNGGQIIVDQFLSSAEEKWGQHCGLVLLLPHGQEGQGPEHSSGRLERFLTLCAEGNMQVVYPTTPSQYFHLLRRQMRHDPRKPLVVMTPKSLLRLPAAVSSMGQLEKGRFEPLLDDPAFGGSDQDRSAVKRIVFTSGKVFYDLAAARENRGAKNLALIRIEQLYPWPQKLVSEIVARYSSAEDFVWVQEEPRNMGAWHFLSEKLKPQLPRELRYVGRPVSASPATGSHTRYEQAQKALVDAALG